MRRCRFCQNTRASICLDGDEFRLLKCKNCGIVFTHPFPSLKVLKIANKKVYGRKINWKDDLPRFSFLNRRAKEIVGEIKKFQLKGWFLDIGCGMGFLLKAAKEAGFKVLGVEKELEVAKLARQKFDIKILAKDFLQTRLPSASFDVIVCFDVLEHIEKPFQFLKQVRRILKKEGLLVVQTPNIESMMAEITGRKWKWLLLPNHLWHFSPATLKSILEKENFKILKLETIDDLSEFNFNLIDVLEVRKTNFFSKIIWKALRVGFFGLAPLSFLWSKLGKGGLIRVYAQKR